MTGNRGSSDSSFHGRPPLKVTKLRRHTSSKYLFSLPRLETRFLNASGRGNYVHWTTDLCPMQCRGQLNFGIITPISSISKHFLAPYFTHVQIFHIIDNWHATSTQIHKNRVYMWLHCTGSMFDYIAVSVWLHEEQWLQIRSALTGLHQIAGIMRPVSTLTGRVPPEKWKQCEHRKIKTNFSIWELIAGNGQIFEKRRFYKKSPDRINHWGMLFSCPAMQLFFGHLKYSSPDLSHGAFQIIWIKISNSTTNQCNWWWWW